MCWEKCEQTLLDTHRDGGLMRKHVARGAPWGSKDGDLSAMRGFSLLAEPKWGRKTLEGALSME